MKVNGILFVLLKALNNYIQKKKNEQQHVLQEQLPEHPVNGFPRDYFFPRHFSWIQSNRDIFLERDVAFELLKFSFNAMIIPFTFIVLGWRQKS